MTDIGELVVRIKADATALERELKRVGTTTKNELGGMEKAASAFKAQLMALVPAITVGSLIAFAKNASQAAARLTDLADRTGIAATTLSALEIPLIQAGSNVDSFAMSITRMNNAIGEAAGNDIAAKVFTDIGLSVQDLLAMSPEEQFNTIARALAGISSQAEFTNKGMAIFGRQFSSIAPIIRQTNGEMEQFIKRQQELGNSFTAEELKLADEFWDRMDANIKKAEVALVRLIGKMAQLTGMSPDDRLKSLTDTELKELDQEINTRRARLSALEKSPSGLSQDFIEKNRRELADLEARREVMRGHWRTQNQVKYGEVFGPNLAAASKSLPPRESSSTATAAAAKAQQDHNAHLEDYGRAMEEADRATQELTNTLKSKLSSSLTDAVFDAENAGQAFHRMMDNIARAIFEKSIAQPFSNAIVDGVGSSGLFDSIGGFLGGLIPSFDVGSYNIPQDTMAMVHKGEMIIPAKEAQQLRSGGGGGVTIVQNNTFQSGVTRGEVEQMLPQVAAAATNAVFSEIQRGGTAAKLVGVR